MSDTTIILKLKLKNMKKLLFITLMLLSATTFSRTLTSNGNGDWDDPNTWTPFGVPSSFDTVVILQGDTINVDCNCGTYTSVLLQVYGVLSFDNGQKLKFSSPSFIEVYSGAKLYGNNPGSKIVIDNNDVYRGRDTLFGPSTCDGTGCFPNATLPIELLSFDTDYQSGHIIANWETLSEINNSHFIVEGSTDGSSWTPYSRTLGSGNSSQIRRYSTKFLYNKNEGYFRLAQYDFDGTVSYSEITYTKADVVPQNEWREVYNMKGQEVDFSQTLQRGIYVVKYDGGQFKIFVQ